MKVITNLPKLEQDLAERLGSVEMAQEIIKDYSEEIYHGWTNEDIASQALSMVDHDHDLADIEAYRDELVDFLLGSEDFNIEAIGEKFNKVNDASDIGVTWVTVEWAVEEVHSHSTLAEIVAKGITEAKSNDGNIE